MLSLRRTTATLGAAALLAAPLAAASPAVAADREFRYAGAEIEFDVEKDDGRYEIDVDVDDAKPRSKWRIKILHNGKVVHNRIHRADSDGEIDVDRVRRDTRRRDTFKLTIKKIPGPRAKSSVIRRR